MELVTSYYEAKKGEFYTVEAYNVTWNEEEQEWEEGDRFEAIDTYYVQEIDTYGIMEYLNKLIEEVELEDNQTVKVVFVPRRWAQFTYNHRDEHYEEVEYGDPCMGHEEYICEGQDVVY